MHNFLCYFNPLRRVGFACLAGWKIKKRKQSKRDQTEGGQLRACIIFGSLVLGETQWGERVKLEWRFLKITFGSSGGGCSSHSLIPSISFRLLEGWPPGLGKGEISGEWRRQAKLPTGSFQPAWAQSSSDRVPGEVTQVLWLTPENSWSGSGVIKRIKEGSHQKGSMDSFICRKTGPRTLGWRPSDTITLNT